MTYINPIWAEGQCKRWLRHDWRNWVKPEAHHLYEGLEKKRALRFDEVARQRKAEAAEIAAAKREQEAFEQELRQLRRMVKDLQIELALRRLEEKFDPNQPRVPAGSPDGGQWPSGGESGSGRAESPTISDVTPDNDRIPGAQYAQVDRSTGYPVDLMEERRLGGHAIEGHVGKSQEFLLGRVHDIAARAARMGDFAEGLRAGSFITLESANKLVNAAVAQNQAKVDLVVRGLSPREELDARFDSPTGHEAYSRTERSQPYIRQTYGVRVVIVPDKSAAKGYRVDTAFPTNFGR